MKQTKAKKDAFDYLAWGGQFVTPELDPELFARLPGWRQREHKLIVAASREGRRVSLEELKALRDGDPDKVRLRYSFPATLHLANLKSRYQTSAPVGDITQRLRELVTADTILQNITAFGEGHFLVRTQPPGGVYAYLWWAALLRRKITTSIPVSALLELEDGIYAMTGLWLSLEEAPETLFTWLNAELTTLLSSVA